MLRRRGSGGRVRAAGAAKPEPGDLLMLPTDVRDLARGFYLLDGLSGRWARLRRVFDDEKNDRLWVARAETALPAAGLQLFTPVGIRLN